MSLYAGLETRSLQERLRYRSATPVKTKPEDPTVSRLITVQPYLADLWHLMKKLPEGQWSAVPDPSGSESLGRHSLQAGGTEILRVRRPHTGDQWGPDEQTKTVLALIVGLRNCMPQLVVDMATLIGVQRILNVAREVSGTDQDAQVDELQFTLQLAEALEAFKRAEDVIPRHPNERMTAWVERVVHRLAVLETISKDTP